MNPDDSSPELPRDLKQDPAPTNARFIFKPQRSPSTQSCDIPPVSVNSVPSVVEILPPSTHTPAFRSPLSDFVAAVTPRFKVIQDVVLGVELHDSGSLEKAQEETGADVGVCSGFGGRSGCVGAHLGRARSSGETRHTAVVHSRIVVSTLVFVPPPHHGHPRVSNLDILTNRLVSAKHSNEKEICKPSGTCVEKQVQRKSDVPPGWHAYEQIGKHYVGLQEQTSDFHFAAPRQNMETESSSLKSRAQSLQRVLPDKSREGLLQELLDDFPNKSKPWSPNPQDSAAWNDHTYDATDQR